MPHTQPMPPTPPMTRSRPPYTAFALTGLAAALTLPVNVLPPCPRRAA